ncbi:MAG: TrmH family RNA methyltransferase [Metamycoplasmataceae bacterium]
MKLKQKKYRDLEKMYIIEGFHLVNEALKHSVVLEIFSTEYFLDFEKTFIVNEKIISDFSSTKTPQNIIAICIKKEKKILAKKILFLNKINDPGNLGTLIRSACAFGIDQVVVQGVDLYNSKVLRSSQGAIFEIDAINIDDSFAFLKNNSLKKYGAILDKNAINYFEAPILKEFILILGNEANGIEEKIIPLLDHKIYIPINFESLNVAVAGSILLNHFFQEKIIKK